MNYKENIYIAYYADSLGSPILENLTDNLLKTTLIKRENIKSVIYETQHRDNYNDGFWAIQNVFNINFVLNSANKEAVFLLNSGNKEAIFSGNKELIKDLNASQRNFIEQAIKFLAWKSVFNPIMIYPENNFQLLREKFRQQIENQKEESVQNNNQDQAIFDEVLGTSKMEIDPPIKENDKNEEKMDVDPPSQHVDKPQIDQSPLKKRFKLDDSTNPLPGSSCLDQDAAPSSDNKANREDRYLTEWLTDGAIRSIAKAYNDKIKQDSGEPMFKLHTYDNDYENSTNGLVVLIPCNISYKSSGICNEFDLALGNFIGKNKERVRARRTFIINAGGQDSYDLNEKDNPSLVIFGNHWVTLVVDYQKYREDSYRVYYADSFAVDIEKEERKNIYTVLRNRLNSIRPKPVIHKKQQKDGYNCGLWAIQNAFNINIILNNNDAANALNKDNDLSAVLDKFTKIVNKLILHDPGNPNSFTTTRFEYKNILECIEKNQYEDMNIRRKRNANICQSKKDNGENYDNTNDDQVESDSNQSAQWSQDSIEGIPINTIKEIFYVNGKVPYRSMLNDHFFSRLDISLRLDNLS